MGNAINVADEAINSSLSTEEKVDQQVKSTSQPSSEAEQKTATEKITNNASKTSERHSNNSGESVESDRHSGEDDSEDGDDENDLEPHEVLLQFIPYYGQGDPSNDSIVRAQLASLPNDDIEAKDEYGNTLLLLACQYRCLDLVSMMLNKNADPNAVNSSGACGLHFACYRDSSSFDVAKLLLQNGAAPDVAESTFGCTPLHYCAGTGDINFCKLLLTFGAKVSSRDYYNYTCIDYAKEAGMAEVEKFLQNHLEKERRFSVKSTKVEKSDIKTFDHDVWSLSTESYGTKWFKNSSTGEVLTENDLNQRRAAQRKQEKQSTSKAGTPSTLITIATMSRLVAFMLKHDSSRIREIDDLTSQYRGKEEQLLKNLCEKYNVPEKEEMEAFQAKLKEIKQNTPTNEFVGAMPEQNPEDIHRLEQKLEMNYQKQMEEEKKSFKLKLDNYMETDRANHRKLISEKEGIVAKLKEEVETYHRQKLKIEDDLKIAHSKLEKVNISGGEQKHKAEEEIVNLKSENSALKTQIHKVEQHLKIEQDKYKDLELNMSNLTADSVEKLAAEKKAAENRAREQKENEEKVAATLQEVETKMKNMELKLKSDLNNEKSEWKKIEKEMKEEYDSMKKSNESEIEGLHKELAEAKGEYGKTLSDLTLQLEDLRREVKEKEIAASDALAMAKAAEDEIAASKIVHAMNDQLHRDLLKEQAHRKKLHNDLEDLKGKIRVYVRVRPLSKSEQEKNCTESVLKDGKQSVMVKGIGNPDSKKVYDFDSVFAGSESNSQEDVFKDTKHLMMSVIDGYNVCIFAYGQTGAGKSFTMIGAADISKCLDEKGDFNDLAGIAPRAVSEIFRLLDDRKTQVEATVEVQMFQLYRDGLEDLLKETKKGGNANEKEKPLKITLADHSPTGLVYIEGAEQLKAETPQEVMKIFAKGSSRRAVASTQMNAESSRSHLICTLIVTLKNKKTDTETRGKLTLVDLAGSERVDKSGASGETLKEAQSINKSLSALGDVISALTTGGAHIPYRNHPLTMLMSDSIGGNSKTLMFVNTSPADYNTGESNSSLQFAQRCKDVTNMASTANGSSAAQVNALKKELAKLKKTSGSHGTQLSGLKSYK